MATEADVDGQEQVTNPRNDFLEPDAIYHQQMASSYHQIIDENRGLVEPARLSSWEDWRSFHSHQARIRLVRLIAQARPIGGSRGL